MLRQPALRASCSAAWTVSGTMFVQVWRSAWPGRERTHEVHARLEAERLVGGADERGRQVRGCAAGACVVSEGHEGLRTCPR